MPLNQNDNQKENKPIKPVYTGGKPNPFAFLFFFAMAGLFIYYFFRNNQTVQEAAYSDFLQYMERDEVTRVKIFDASRIEGERRTQGGEVVWFKTIIPYMDPALLPELRARNIIITGVTGDSLPWRIVLQILPWLIGLGLVIFMFRNMQGTGSRTLQFGKSKAKRYHDDGKKVTFSDVAGQTDAKYELQEVVSFLKNPQKFTKMGARIPKGVLLVGMPGTGKTLMAKAVAGEAGVNFFHMSGSDFVEMFVGVGASRVRDLFDQGRRSAPCIIFIDELDAVGRTRGAGYGGGHDEREQTLNQLLVEMDGFDSKDGVIILAATNRPDVLDPALLRPGRFDRQVIVAMPDIKEREAILKIHAVKIPLAESIDLSRVARATPGMSGAEIANLINEAALFAARRDKAAVEMADLEDARDKVLMGVARKTLAMSDKERRMTAIHEAGHALLHYFLENADPLHKVTIVPHGRALGMAMSLPEEDSYSRTKSWIRDRIVICYGGWSAEMLFYNETTTGAKQDLEQATDMARRMVCEWGMAEELGPITYGQEDEPIFLGKEIARHKDYSEETARRIDNAVKHILEEARAQAETILGKHKKDLEKMADALLVRETLGDEEVRILLNLPPKEETKHP
ncbi:MAG: ATP-dependent zinc metalloprotease FtsH [Spirochaetaceae bacterium]|jgi:cell division protease FtsH|nr:ATP-dependent zinc metalloprotease FtsH [Spirochaetaceae bacterium]